MAKRPRREGQWFEAKAGVEANDTEMLFFTLLVVAATPYGGVGALNEWAQSILDHEKAFLADGTIPTEWKSSRKVKVPPIYARIYAAYDRRGTNETLERIGAAIQAWPEAGGKVELSAPTIKKHFQMHREKKLTAPKVLMPKVLMRVAKLIKGSGPELRKLVRDDTPREERPTPVEEIKELTQQNAALTSQLAATKEALAKKTDAHRKAAERAKEKNKAKTKAVRDVRKHERRQRVELSKTERNRLRAQLKEARKRVAEKERERAEAREVQEREKLQTRIAAARKRARAVESAAKDSRKRLKRAQKAEAQVKELQAALEEEPEEEAEEQEAPATLEGSRRDARGRWQAIPQRLRILIWAQLSRRVAPSAVASNIHDALSAYAHGTVEFLPCEREIAKMRGELTIASEAIAAFRVALSKRIISFGWDESTKFGLGLLSSNTQIETQEGEIVDVVMRGATLTAGGTAEAIAWSIDTKIFSHARRLLADWKAAHEAKFDVGSWAAAGGPEPESIGIHRLSEETLLMSDTCNGARACKRLVSEAAMKAGIEKVGQEAWDALTQQQRDAKCKVYVGQCHQHLRNIIINAMQIRATESLKETLEDSLSEFSSFDRMSVDVNDLIRSVYKELHGGGAYAKGKGREFMAWLKKNYPTAQFMPFERAAGSRQDLAFDGAVPIFVNRKIIIEFVRGMMVPGADNRLERFILRVLGCNEMTAALRVNTLWKYIFSAPVRFLSGRSRRLKNWSIDSSSRLMDLIEKAMVEVAADGRRLLDPTFDPFAEIATEQPLFCKWRDQLLQRQVASSNGSARHPVHQWALDEARSPTGAGNVQAEETTVMLAQQMANAALVAMRDPKRAICSLLTSQDGEHAVGKDASVHVATIGANVTNDRVESNFGCVDTLMRMYRYATVENISGMAQQMVNHDFDRPLPISHDRGRKRKEQDGEAPPEQRGGFFHFGLTPTLQWSLVEYVRRQVDRARKDGRAAMKAQEEEKLSRREERVITLLNKAVEHYAYAKECFEAWETQRATSQAEIAAALVDEASGKSKPEAAQLEWLRYQIEMRVLGLGWTQYQTRWSSKADSRIGTVAHLQTLLEEIVEEEVTRGRFRAGSEQGLPTEAAPPHHQSRELGQLGTADADAVEISKRALFSAAELDAKAEAAMKRREVEGVADRVERMQPQEAPAFDQALVGQRIEVLWKYFDRETNAPQMIWSTGTVKRIADGLTDKRSKRAQKILPGGAVLWAWDADPEFDEQAGEQWLILLPKKFNPKTHKAAYSWRLDPRELGAAQGNASDVRRKGARRAMADVGTDDERD